MAEPYAGTCKDCKFVVAHSIRGDLTGYGHCTKHLAYQLKTVENGARIQNTPIVWHECSCPIGETKE